MFVRPNATCWIAKCCLWVLNMASQRRPDATIYRIKQMRCQVQRKWQDVRIAKLTMIAKCFKRRGANCEKPLTQLGRAQHQRGHPSRLPVGQGSRRQTPWDSQGSLEFSLGLRLGCCRLPPWGTTWKGSRTTTNTPPSGWPAFIRIRRLPGRHQHKQIQNTTWLMTLCYTMRLQLRRIHESIVYRL